MCDDRFPFAFSVTSCEPMLAYSSYSCKLPENVLHKNQIPVLIAVKHSDAAELARWTEYRLADRCSPFTHHEHMIAETRTIMGSKTCVVL